MAKVIKINPQVKPKKIKLWKDPEYIESLKKLIVQDHNKKLKK